MQLQRESFKYDGKWRRKIRFYLYKGPSNGGISLCIDNDKSKNEIFNLTYGNARKISELIDIIRGLLPKSFSKKFAKR